MEASPANARSFSRFELDPNNPWHWRLLLESFVEVGMKGPGPRKKLVHIKYFHLSEHVAELMRDRHLKTHIEIARRLKSDKRFKAQYSSITLRTLRSHVASLDFGSFEENFRELQRMMKGIALGIADERS
ncbi:MULTISPECIES: hypothetical protein [unclassified Bradyrhizobium]|uniref:hypothetical protein n=1 Tax=Bradyrhizobium sp. USDA 4541 TaxID=2817704 RepID=UPI0020A27020|nr:hypothetical protein [Bradyrhizobium sp. USDA 4541]MCP1848368.1 hypothetical protein [Bradyrhizobium sp. USDA 4541]